MVKTGSTFGTSLGSNSRGYHTDKAVSTSVDASQFSCLYTKHKTRKKKVWNDGRLVLISCQGWIHDADPLPGSGDPALDECEISGAQRAALMQNKETRLETSQFLVEVVGPWVAPFQNCNLSSKKEVSASMQKLLNRKFRKPTPFVPPSSRPGRLQMALGKRRRPLQPGELERHHAALNHRRCANLTTTNQPGCPSPHDLSFQDMSGCLETSHRNKPRMHSTLHDLGSTPRNAGGYTSQATPIPPPPRNANEPKRKRFQSPAKRSETFDALVSSSYPGHLQGQEIRSREDGSTPSETNEHRAPSSAHRAGSPYHSAAKKNIPAASLHQFASNSFNASAFYGLDEEEESERRESSAAPPEAYPSGGEDNCTATAYSRASERSSEPVSGVQLLAVFGALPLSPNNSSVQAGRANHLGQDDPATPQVGFYLQPCTSPSSSDDSDS